MLQPVPEHRCSILSVVEDGWVNMPVNMLGYKWEEIVPPGELLIGTATKVKHLTEDDFKLKAKCFIVMCTSIFILFYATAVVVL